MGLQQGFDWQGVAIGAIGAGVTSGLGAAAAAAGGAGTLASIGRGLDTIGLAGRAAVGNALTQGISVAIGLQSSFSWGDVAISAVAAPIADAVGNEVGGVFSGTGASNFANSFTAGVTGSLVRGAFRGKIDTASILADAFGNALGNSIVDGLIGPAIEEFHPTAKRIGGQESELRQGPAMVGSADAPLHNNPAGESFSGAGASLAAAAMTNGSGYEAIENVVTTAQSWRAREEDHYWREQSAYYNAFGRFLSEDDATQSATDLYQQDVRDRFAAIRDRNDAILLDGFSPIGPAKSLVAGSLNLAVKAGGGALSTLALPWGVDSALGVQSWVSGARVEADSPFADMVARDLAPSIDRGRTWLEDTIGIGATVTLGATAEFALDVLALMPALSNARRLNTLSERPLQSVDNQLNSFRSGRSTTGVEQFDQLFSESPQASKMINALERRGVTVIGDAKLLDPRAAGHVAQVDGRLTL